MAEAEKSVDESIGDGAEPRLNREEAIKLFESMKGMWTGWFEDEGGVDAYFARMRNGEEEPVEPSA